MSGLMTFLVQQSHELGFCAVGVADTSPFTEHAAQALRRIEDGFMADMSWFNEARVRCGADPRAVLPNARSIISVVMRYPLSQDCPGLGARVSRFAWGADYHVLIKSRIKELLTGLSRHLGHDVGFYINVDDGPLPDRAAAVRAGVGWPGKNTNVLVQGVGSWAFLGEAVVDVDLEPSSASTGTCGACTRCLDACPTGALVAPYMLDSRKCISYLTVENREAIPRALRHLVGDRLFGCDACQEVCPANKGNTAAYPNDTTDASRLTAILSMDGAEFRHRFRGTAIWRAKLEGLQRNACVVLGNLRDEKTVPALAGAARTGTPLVRMHAAWALGRIGGRAARAALERALAVETDAVVRAEIESAITS